MHAYSLELDAPNVDADRSDDIKQPSDSPVRSKECSAARIQKIERAIKDTIMAIEGGTEIHDHRGKVYQQQFGEAFLKRLKDTLEVLPNESNANTARKPL